MSPQQTAHGALMTIAGLADLLVNVQGLRHDADEVSGITAYHEGAILAAIYSLADQACLTIEQAQAQAQAQAKEAA